MKNIFSLLCFLFSAVLFLPQGILAEENAYEHDGFFLRTLVGAGFSQMEYNPPVKNRPKYEASGISPFAAFQIGRAATKDLIMHFNTFYIYNPEREAKAESSADTGERKQYYNSFALGIGLTYYLPWANIYISPEYRAAVFSRSETRFQGPSDAMAYTTEVAKTEGHGVGFTFGKEFWISNEWGMGIALMYIVDWLSFSEYKSRSPVPPGSPIEPFSAVPEGRLDEGTSRQTFIGIAFSATYN